MKKFLTLLLATIMCVLLCSCGSSNEKINEISEYVNGKTFYLKVDDVTEKEEGYYFNAQGKEVSGGVYFETVIREYLLTFNADGTVDRTEYVSTKVETKFTEEQRRHSNVEDFFADSSSTSQYGSYSVTKKEKDDDFYVINLYIDEHTKDWTLYVFVNEDGSYTLKGHNRIMEEVPNSTTLPTKDYSK